MNMCTFAWQLANTHRIWAANAECEKGRPNSNGIARKMEWSRRMMMLTGGANIVKRTYRIPDTFGEEI